LQTLSSTKAGVKVSLQCKAWIAQPEEWYYYKLTENIIAASRR
jgi:hypothetical protein